MKRTTYHFTVEPPLDEKQLAWLSLQLHDLLDGTGNHYWTDVEEAIEWPDDGRTE